MANADEVNMDVNMKMSDDYLSDLDMEFDPTTGYELDNDMKLKAKAKGAEDFDGDDGIELGLTTAADLKANQVDNTNSSKPKASFFTVSREIRDQIYEYILAPTGFILFDEHVNNDNVTTYQIAPVKSAFPYLVIPGSEIDLSFFRVCKQISNEAPNIFWSKNTMLFQTNDNFPELKVPSLMAQVQNAHLIVKPPPKDVSRGVDVLLNQGLFTPRLNGILKNLGASKQLKNFTIVLWDGLNPSFPKPPLRKINNTREQMQKFLGSSNFQDIMKAARGYMVGKQCKTVLIHNIKGLTAQMSKEAVAQFSIDIFKLADDINKCFGGELFVGDQLCFKDGKEVEKLAPLPFQLTPVIATGGRLVLKVARPTPRAS